MATAKMHGQRSSARSSGFILFGAVALLVAAVGTVAPAVSHVVDGVGDSLRDNGDRTMVAEAYGRVPLTFEANVGQADPEVKFQARAGASTLFLTSTEAVLAGKKHDAFRWRLVGADPAAQPVGISPQSTITNYYRGAVSDAWREKVPSYGAVAYRGVYPGVDVVYYGNQRQMEYDLLVAAGADPTPIAMDFAGAKGLRIDDQGNLLVRLGDTEVSHRRPIAYQDGPVGRKKVAARYVRDGEHIRFALGTYDRSRPLVIDPIIYSTFLGGSNFDYGIDIALDGAGNAYVTGGTESVDFPTVNPVPGGVGGGQDVFVSKFNLTGSSLVFSTYLSGSTSPEQGQGIVVDSDGNAYVTGPATAGFPTTTGAIKACQAPQDAFVSKLSAIGALAYSTCIGGSGVDWGFGVGIHAGNAYVAGYTNSTDFPTASPLVTGASLKGTNDAFVAELNTTGTGFVYSTYLGGTGDDRGLGIAVDTLGSAYVTGWTRSSDFPTAGSPVLKGSLGGGQDVFVSKLDLVAGALSLAYSTYLGGSATDGQTTSSNIGIQVDAGGNAYVAAPTGSADFPRVGPFQNVYAGGTSDVFVAKLNPSGSSLIFSTFLGGGGSDGQNSTVDLALDNSNNVYLVGRTTSLNFPVTRADPVKPARPGSIPLFVAELDSTGSTLLSSTYFGQGNEATPGIAVDTAGVVYLTGAAQSASFPVTANAYQTFLNGGSDAFVTKVDFGVGFLRVTTNPSLPSQILVDGVPRATYGIINLEVGPGSHDVCFREVEGFLAPACQTVSVAKGATTVVTGNFAAKGFLQVQTSPAVPAKISVDGIPRDDWGVFTDLPVGAHQVCFGPLADLSPPPCQNVALAAGTTTPVTGTYTSQLGAPGEPAGNGALRVTTSPALPSQISVDGVARATYGLINLQLAPGSHQVCYREVEGFVGPAACQVVSVTAGATTVTQGAFTAKGFLQATTSPAVPAPVYVDGVARDDWGLFTDYTVGSHEVCFGAIARTLRPNCQTVTLSAGTTTPATGAYLPA